MQINAVLWFFYVNGVNIDTLWFNTFSLIQWLIKTGLRLCKYCALNCSNLFGYTWPEVPGGIYWAQLCSCVLYVVGKKRICIVNITKFLLPSFENNFNIMICTALQAIIQLGMTFSSLIVKISFSRIIISSCNVSTAKHLQSWVSHCGDKYFQTQQD